MRILIAILFLVIGLMLYIRLAPTQPERWHNRPTADAPTDRDEEGGYQAVRRMTAPAAEVLAEMRKIALETPRTELVAGSVDEGMMTFRTRSAFWGFPDFTTVAAEGDLLVIYGRLRFGRSDMGVNKARVRDWLDRLGPLTEPR